MRTRSGGSPAPILVVAAVPALALAACVAGPAAPATAQEGASPDPFPGATVVELPARCDGHRFWVTPATADGDSLDLLFDTGATVRLTDGARADPDAGERTEQGTSFIVRSVYEEWRRRHPDWRVIRDAERGTGAPMIRVPEISVAGYAAGPVWFTVRPDANFREGMSRWMDREVDGALGGSALHHFRVLVDYPRATAVFLEP